MLQKHYVTKKTTKGLKNVIAAACLAVITALPLVTQAQTQQHFPHIKTFGFDYVRFQDSNGALEENLRWLANRHDWIVGPKAAWPAQGVDYMDTWTYDVIKDENPNTKIMKYLPYHSIAPTTMTWLENWAVNNGKDPEELYYHYYYDTTINLSNGNTLTIPGYGGGSASTLEESRVRVRWNGGWVGINPSSSTFRLAFQALAQAVINVRDEEGDALSTTYVDGLFLDTFEGIVDTRYWTSHLENTIELKDIGTTDEIYAQARADLVQSKVELETFLIDVTGNSSFRLHVNSADADYIYNNYSSLYNEAHRDDLIDISVEFLVTTTTNESRIQRFQQIYDDMENGRLFFIRSQTNFAPPTTIPFAFSQFMLAAHYLVNHANAHFMYHYGGAGNYGGYPYGDPKPTHWHQNMEVDIGQPISRTQADYWGENNTDRFFTFAEGADYTILGREYGNALVLAKFARVGGWANIGNAPTTHNLDGEYYPLLEDNTLGTAVTSITLGTSEGIILIKNPSSATIEGPDTLNATFRINL